MKRWRGYATVRYAGVLASASKWRPLIVSKLGIDVETCPRCGGRMRLLALITDPPNVARFLCHLGEPSEHLLPGPDGLVRITLKRPFSDGTTQGALWGVPDELRRSGVSRSNVGGHVSPKSRWR